MNSDQWQRVDELLHLALQRRPAERDQFLQQACRGEKELEDEVRSLLRAQQEAGSFLESPAVEVAAQVLKIEDPGDSAGLCPKYLTQAAFDSSIRPDESGSQADAEAAASTSDDFGRYRILRLLGEGGMGTVYLAQQREPVRRDVALKVVKLGMDTSQVLARFAYERQALALMDHPAIATVFDAGSTPRGTPYFVMEYVAGLPITKYCDNHRLSTRERLELFKRVCEGVQHAHQKAIIHRDLKPSNILVTEVDDRAMPKIIDFGVAKALTQKPKADTFFTRLGVMIGTPEYMSPEQALSSGEDIDTRTDVYSLGVILYELLAGVPPIELLKITFEEFLRKLREEEPPKPSTKIRTQDAATSTEMARKRRSEPAALSKQIRGDLDSIVLKALEKDRSRRYGSPSDLATDIGRYLNNEPVQAVPPSFVYRARKYVRRHRAGLAVAAMAVLLLASIAVTQAIQVQRVTRERDHADRERDRANRVTDFMTNMFMQADPSQARGNTITAREVLDKASQGLDAGLAQDPELKAQMLDIMGRVYQGLGLYPKAEALLARAIDIRRRVLGVDNANTLATDARLGWVLYQEARHFEAEKLLRKTLDRSRAVLGPSDATTLAAMQYLALALSEQGRGAEAEKLVRAALDIEKRDLGPEHPETIFSTDRLASVLDGQGKFAEAEKLHRQTLELRRRLYGHDHPETALSLHNLANVLASEGRFAEAEKFYREAMELDLRVLGPEHPKTLNVMNDLADDLSDQGHYQESEKLNRTVLEIRRRVFGPDHKITASSMYNLGCLAALTGQREEAISLLRQAVDHGLDADLDLRLDKDNDLKSLHGDPRFTALVAHAKERASTAPPRVSYDPTFPHP